MKYFEKKLSKVWRTSEIISKKQEIRHYNSYLVDNSEMESLKSNKLPSIMKMLLAILV